MPRASGPGAPFPFSLSTRGLPEAPLPWRRRTRFAPGARDRAPEVRDDRPGVLLDRTGAPARAAGFPGAFPRPRRIAPASGPPVPRSRTIVPGAGGGRPERRDRGPGARDARPRPGAIDPRSGRTVPASEKAVPRSGRQGIVEAVEVRSGDRGPTQRRRPVPGAKLGRGQAGLAAESHAGSTPPRAASAPVHRRSATATIPPRSRRRGSIRSPRKFAASPRTIEPVLGDVGFNSRMPPREMTRARRTLAGAIGSSPCVPKAPL